MGPFDQLEQLPPDPIFGLSAEFKNDKRTNKYTLITGYFRGDDLTTPLLPSVAEAESILTRAKERREYLPIGGDQGFVSSLQKIIFGEPSERLCGFQTVGGTGALYLIGRLATQFTHQIGISQPTWANHWGIFSLAGLKTVGYPYYEKKKLVFDQMIEKLHTFPANSAVLIHAGGHNPTGLDLTKDQWKELSLLMEKKKLFPILDMAYQGFSGTLEEDAYGAGLFLKAGFPFALTYTCAKNFSIYGERAGALFILAKTKHQLPAIESQILKEIRGSYSNPPTHAASIVKTVLQDTTLHRLWEKELETMRARMKKIRNTFFDRLSAKDPKRGMGSLEKGTGLFFYSEKSPEAVSYLQKEKGFYIASDGRVNLTGLNDQNVESFVDSFVETK